MAPKIAVLAGASGSGKGTLVKAVRARQPGIRLPISCTSRKPRPGERHGVEYYFVSRLRFIWMIITGQFVEWARVHGNFYGTPRSELERGGDGQITLLEIDCQGARQIKRRYPSAKLIFVFPPSPEELESRLYARGTDTPEVIERRLRNAQGEIRESEYFDYFVINQHLAVAVLELEKLLNLIASGAEPNMTEYFNSTRYKSVRTAFGI